MRKLLAIATLCCVGAFAAITTSELTLYVKKSCPYCTKVDRYIDAHNLRIKTIDITNNMDARETLIKTGGKAQVPCLFVNGKPMYESRAIITFLKKQFEY
jgi:glutaredoxin 3